MKETPRTIQSVQRAIDIINCIGDANQRLGLKEISAKLKLNINTTRGLVQTLLVNGFLSKDITDGTYFLGYEFLTKSKKLYQMNVQQIRDIALPYMKNIANRYGVSTWLQISFYRKIYTVEVVEPSNSFYSYVPVSGTDLPLHASASGKLYVAYMPENEQKKVISNLDYQSLTQHTIADQETYRQTIEKIYEQEYATEMEEINIGVCSLAVPLFDFYGEMKGALSIAGTSETVKKSMKALLGDLKQAKNQIERSGFQM